MKKILLGIALIPIFSFAQNPFDLRTNKSKDGKAPNVEAENIDGGIGKTLDNSRVFNQSQRWNLSSYHPFSFPKMLKYHEGEFFLSCLHVHIK